MKERLLPEILYLDAKKQQQYYEVDGPVLVGSSTECNITLAPIVGVSAKHLIFAYDNEARRHTVKNVGDEAVFLNNTTLEPTQKLFLGYKNIFLLGDKSKRDACQPLVFLDPERQEQDETHVKTLKIKKGIPKEIEDAVTTLIHRFYSELQNIPPTTKDVCKYFTKFISEIFSVSTLVLYKRSGTSWQSMSVFRSNKKETYRPSTLLYQKAVDTKTPIFFKIEADNVEVGKDIVEASASIVESGARRVIIIPLIQKERCFGMVYIDGKDEELLTDLEFQKLNCLLVNGGIQGTLSGYLAENLDQLNFLPISTKALPKSWNWRFLIANYHIHYPLASFKIFEEAGRARLFYGTCGNDLEKAVRMKAMLDGMQEIGIRTTIPHDLLTVAESYRKAMQDNPTKTIDTFKAVDFCLTFPPQLKTIEEDLDTIDLGKKNIDTDLDDNELRINFTEGIYVCARHKQKTEDIERKTTAIELTEFKPLDFVVASTQSLPRHIQKFLNTASDVNTIISKLKAIVKDFVILIREK